MTEYAVVVKYPDRLWDPNETYYVALVDEPNLLSAIHAGRKEAMMSQPPADRGKLDEWEEVLTFRGHPVLEHVA